MAKKVIEHLVDDVDGSVATVTVHIGWNGEWRELDLNEKNEAALSKVLDRYWDKGRPWEPLPSSRRAVRRRPRAATTAAPARAEGERGYSLPELREWAARRGVRVPARGRIPRDVVAQYQAERGQ
jgi:hypothetical protein